MERTAKLKYTVIAAYAAVMIIEIFTIAAFLTLFFAGSTGEMSYFALLLVNVVGAMTLHEMLKAWAREQDDRYEAYCAALGEVPLPGPLYRLTRAVIKRRRPQGGWLRL